MENLGKRCAFLCSDDNPTPCLTKDEQACFCGTALGLSVFPCIALIVFLSVWIIVPTLGVLLVAFVGPVLGCTGSVPQVIPACVRSLKGCYCAAAGGTLLGVLIGLAIIVSALWWGLYRLKRACYSPQEMECLRDNQQQ